MTQIKTNINPPLILYVNFLPSVCFDKGFTFAYVHLRQVQAGVKLLKETGKSRVAWDTSLVDFTNSRFLALKYLCKLNSLTEKLKSAWAYLILERKLYCWYQ